MMTLRGLVEKTYDTDLPREVISFATQRMMEMEGLIGAVYLAYQAYLFRSVGLMEKINQQLRI